MFEIFTEGRTWEKFGADLWIPDIPETIFNSLWRDITFRAKMIALCSKFGPSYMATMAALRKKVMEVNEDLSPIDSMFVKIIFADYLGRIVCSLSISEIIWWSSQ